MTLPDTQARLATRAQDKSLIPADPVSASYHESFLAMWQPLLHDGVAVAPELPSSEDLPKVSAVPVVDGGGALTRMDVGLCDIADEYYCLQMQVALRPWSRLVASALSSNGLANASCRRPD